MARTTSGSAGKGGRREREHAPRDLGQQRVVKRCTGTPGKRSYYWDQHISGFGIRVDPPADAKAAPRRTWILDYRFNGRQRRLTIGDVATITPKQAKDTATRAVGGLAGIPPIDPLAERAEARAAERLARSAAARDRANAATVDDVAARWLASLEVRSSSHRWPTEARRLYDAHVRDVIGRRTVRDVSTGEIRLLLEKLAHTKTTANRARAVLSGIFERALEDRSRPADAGNPVLVVKKHPEMTRTRHLLYPDPEDSAELRDEWAPFGRALAALLAQSPPSDTDTLNAQLRCVLLLLLTGARVGALRKRRWADVNWTSRVIAVEPAEKGCTEIYLGAEAVAWLRAWHDVSDSDFIFPGQRRRIGARVARGQHDARPWKPDTPISSIRDAMRHILEDAEIADFIPHDLRRSFSVVVSDLNISTHLNDGLLSHAIPGVAAHYAHRTRKALRAAADKATAEITQRLRLPAPAVSGAVTPIGAKRRAG